MEDKQEEPKTLISSREIISISKSLPDLKIDLKDAKKEIIDKINQVSKSQDSLKVSLVSSSTPCLLYVSNREEFDKVVEEITAKYIDGVSILLKHKLIKEIYKVVIDKESLEEWLVCTICAKSKGSRVLGMVLRGGSFYSI